MQSAREQVEGLIAELQAKALTIEDLRESVTIAAIARRAPMPEIPPDLIPAFARATLLGAWIQYDIRQMAA